LDSFMYRNGRLYCEEVAVNALAEQVGTPFYLYSANTLQRHYRALAQAFAELQPHICYSIKNCSNINIIGLLAQCGAGIDVVSGGELYRALQAGVAAEKIVFAGVAKSSEELREALEAGVGWINIESEEEFLNARAIAAQLKRTARVALRINPNVHDTRTPDKCATGKKDSKFGVDISHARNFFRTYGRDEFLQLKGVHVHLGSPIYISEPYETAIRVILSLVADVEAAGWASIEMVDLGGGFIAHYDSGQQGIHHWDQYAASIVPLMQPFVQRGGQVILEPGRSISANAGVLISQVQYTKQGVDKKFVMLDTGMNHFIRPMLYDAYHFIWPTVVAPGFEPATRNPKQGMAGLQLYDVVGPICESSDYLARDRELPPLQRGDLLCIYTAGAYCMAMASQYNSRPRPPEVLVDGHSATLIRRRESYRDLIELELAPSPLILDHGR